MCRSLQNLRQAAALMTASPDAYRRQTDWRWKPGQSSSTQKENESHSGVNRVPNCPVLGRYAPCSTARKTIWELSLLYPVHVTTRKSFGLMTRKLSVTESHNSAQLRGTF